MKHKLTAFALTTLSLLSTPAWSGETAGQGSGGLAANYTDGTVDGTEKTSAAGAALRIEVDLMNVSKESLAFELGGRLRFGVASITSPSGTSQGALDIGGRIRLEGGAIFADGCGGYFNGGVMFDAGSVAPFRSGAEVPMPQTAVARLGFGLGCLAKDSDGNVSIVATPYVGAGVSGVEVEDSETGGSLVYGGRANLMLGQFFGIDADVGLHPDLEGKDVSVTMRVTPTEHLAVGADMRVSDRKFAEKDTSGTIDVDAVRGSLFVGGAF